MEGPTGDRMDLDLVDQDRLGLLAVDRQVDDRVGADAATQQLEVMGVDRERRRRDAVAVDDGGELAAAFQRSMAAWHLAIMSSPA